MRVRGKVVSGVMRGTPMIDLYHDRFTGILGTKIFKGTLNVKLERTVDIKSCATKTIGHKLLDGQEKVDIYICPLKLFFRGKEVQCWAIRQAKGAYSKNAVIELVSRCSLREKLGLKDGDEVEIEIVEGKRGLLDKVLGR
jgi:riboflavin kinase